MRPRKAFATGNVIGALFWVIVIGLLAPLFGSLLGCQAPSDRMAAAGPPRRGDVTLNLEKYPDGELKAVGGTVEGGTASVLVVTKEESEWYENGQQKTAKRFTASSDPLVITQEHNRAILEQSRQDATNAINKLSAAVEQIGVLTGTLLQQGMGAYQQYQQFRIDTVLPAQRQHQAQSPGLLPPELKQQLAAEIGTAMTEGVRAAVDAFKAQLQSGGQSTSQPATSQPAANP